MNSGPSTIKGRLLGVENQGRGLPPPMDRIEARLACQGEGQSLQSTLFGGIAQLWESQSMKKLTGGVLGLVVIGVLVYLNFNWEGPSDMIQFARWKVAGSPSWIEWVVR